MAVIREGITSMDGSTISFGDYSVEAKLKIDGFEFGGDIYKVKTHREITRLEKNGKLLLEAVPGAAIHEFHIDERLVSFTGEGFENTQMTLELAPETEYTVFIDGVNTGRMKTNLSGKISFSVDLNQKDMDIKIQKVI